MLGLGARGPGYRLKLRPRQGCYAVQVGRGTDTQTVFDGWANGAQTMRLRSGLYHSIIGVTAQFYHLFPVL